MGGWVCILAVTMILVYTYLTLYICKRLFSFFIFVYSFSIFLFVLSIIRVQGDMEGSAKPFFQKNPLF